jgi:hypothetical protein
MNHGEARRPCLHRKAERFGKRNLDKEKDMKNIKWKRNGLGLLAVMLATVLAFALVGCGGQQQASSTAGGTDTTGSGKTCVCV